MKKKNYGCCGRKYEEFSFKKMNKKCLKCKKGGIKNKNNRCYCDKYLGYKTKKGKIYRQNTAYNENCRNYIICCKECFIEGESFWEEMWNSYYSMI